jgi:glycosyltransferase involved in cell wall biosynthesis
MDGIAKIKIIIPCYNEENVLPITAPMFREQLMKMIDDGRISSESRIVFVDDGSKDNTWKIITELSCSSEYYTGLKLSRNRGHQNALWAGMMESRFSCDAIISIDCDGQDDIGAMKDMVDAFYAGNDVVYGVRNDRNSDTFFKRTSAQMFYKLLNRMGVEAVYNHADYRLISSKVLEHLSEYREVNLFLRGMIPLVGFSSTSVYYKRSERLGGESHYNLSKMVSLAVDGITSLSIKPLRIITMFGMLVSLISFVAVIWAIVTQFTGKAITGWASTISIVCFIGGVQLVSIGVLGEYVGKIYIEVKNRPRYIIAEKTVHDNEEGDRKL